MKGDVERYKASLVAKGSTQTKYIDFKETFFRGLTKDFCRTVMALMFFYLELHYIDVKTTFLNSDINETIHMLQLEENFVFEDGKKKALQIKSIHL